MNALETVTTSLTGFGQKLDAFCADLRDRTQDDSVRLILYHIARWKRRISITIECLTHAEKAEFKDIPLSEKDLSLLSERVFADTFLSPSAGKSDLLETVIGVLEVLTSYYEWFLRQPLGDHVRIFFENLLRRQLEEIGQLKELKMNTSL
jgi:hypothetical protein